MRPYLFIPVIAATAVALVALAAPPSTSQDSVPMTRINEIKEVTYAGQVAQILNDKCVSCHRPGEAAPFSLIGYENARKFSKTIAIVTETKRMPPWKALPGDVSFYDEAHLSDEQIKLLAAWADAGAPRGDASKEPKPPTFAEGWRLGDPDLLWSMPYEHTLGSEGKDEYWNFVIKNDQKEPIWVSAIDVRPGNRQVVHHVIAFLDKRGRGENLAKGEDGDGKLGYKTEGGGIGFTPDGAVGGWAPGATSRRLPDDAGFLVEPGTDVILQVHYSLSGKPEKDKTEVAVYLNKGKVTRPVELAWIANPFINIKPGLADQKFSQTITLPSAIRVYSVMPHMHLLGRSMTATAELPDGKSINLIDVQDWDFNWQLIYAVKAELVLPKGTKLTVRATYDNSSENPFQPNDPPRAVRWGEATTDEMMLLVAAYSVEPVEED